MRIEAKLLQTDVSRVNEAEITSTDLGGGKRGLDVAANVTIPAGTFKDYADGWAAPSHLAVTAFPGAAIAIAPIVNQVSIRLVPTDGRTYYYNFANTMTAATSEPFDSSSPIEIQTNQTVYVACAAGGGAGDIVVYQASRS